MGLIVDKAYRSMSNCRHLGGGDSGPSWCTKTVEYPFGEKTIEKLSKKNNNEGGREYVQSYGRETLLNTGRGANTVDIRPEREKGGLERSTLEEKKIKG